ncbi:MAG TPA: class I SAM-dependent rRNA methyltransferase [Gammaproteobacteria bacterium]|nr:class I SAM-dependent rRNA methyltransferase [Gammaproteobacteria bacterium]
MNLAPLRLKKNEDRRLRAGHLWVFSNEVDVAQTPLTQFEPGQVVVIEASNGAVIGNGYINPHSLICARLVSRDTRYVLDQSLLVHRLNIALSLREKLFDKPYYRLVFGDSDGLPGLIVDRYGAILVAQITTAGMERLKAEIINALQKVIKPSAIVLRNDTSSRAMEGLPSYVEIVLGEIPERVRLEENGVQFETSLLRGQKTGWFYDHRMNRARMQHYVRDKSVLDVFSYIGGWGVQAAYAGAREVVCVDSSVPALEQLQHNAALNALSERVSCQQGDAFEILKALRAERRKFDVVILDPPAFIKRKKDTKEGLQTYRRLNQMALQILELDGILISASCSYHLPRATLQDVLLQASRHIDRNLQILEQGHQGPDHPVHPAIPETDYLKAFFARVLAV